jgi:hypothetical protein
MYTQRKKAIGRIIEKAQVRRMHLLDRTRSKKKTIARQKHEKKEYLSRPRRLVANLLPPP